jgi:hypothetical protein
VLEQALEAAVGAVFLDCREYGPPPHVTTALWRFVCRIAERMVEGIEDSTLSGL